MGQKKLLRFTEIKSFANVLEYPVGMKGEWNGFFKNNNPITLELACGRGEYTTGLASLYPERNFIGVDVKGNRIYIGAKKALNISLKNAAFLRTQIELLDTYFDAGEVQEIWITFPDPHLRTSHAKKRLTHPRFLRILKKIMQSKGIIHLKTDSPGLFKFTETVAEINSLKILEKSANIYAEENIAPELRIRTHYEGLDIAKSQQIFYMKFQLPEQVHDFDQELQKILQQQEMPQLI